MKRKREGAPTSRDPGDDQLSEYDDDSDDFAVGEDGAIRDMQEELVFPFASRRSQSGGKVTTKKALLWT